MFEWLEKIYDKIATNVASSPADGWWTILAMFVFWLLIAVFAIWHHYRHPEQYKFNKEDDSPWIFPPH